jgi:hypothetical protein
VPQPDLRTVVDFGSRLYMMRHGPFLLSASEIYYESLSLLESSIVTWIHISASDDLVGQSDCVAAAGCGGIQPVPDVVPFLNPP